MTKRAPILVFLLIIALLCSSIPVGAQAAPAKKYVIFRDDDVGPGFNFETLKAVNEIHTDKNVPVVLAIVPHPFEKATGSFASDGEESSGSAISTVAAATNGNDLLKDAQLRDYMRSIVTNPLFEFAQHGYTHMDIGASGIHSEFNGKPYEDQFEAIKKGRDDIKEAFGVTPTTFIPPYNKGDGNTLTALKALGFTDYCTGFEEYHQLLKHDYGIRVESSLTIGADNYTSFAETIHAAKNKTDQFLSDPQSGDTLVVAYHHWQFSTHGSVDPQKVKLFGDFIDYLRNRGDVTFARLDRSSWVRVEAAASTSTSTSTSAPVLVNAQGSSLLFVVSAAITVFVGLYWSVGRYGVEKR